MVLKNHPVVIEIGILVETIEILIETVGIGIVEIETIEIGIISHETVTLVEIEMIEVIVVIEAVDEDAVEIVVEVEAVVVIVAEETIDLETRVEARLIGDHLKVTHHEIRVLQSQWNGILAHLIHPNGGHLQQTGHLHQDLVRLKTHHQEAHPAHGVQNHQSGLGVSDHQKNLKALMDGVRLGRKKEAEHHVAEERREVIRRPEVGHRVEEQRQEVILEIAIEHQETIPLVATEHREEALEMEVEHRAVVIPLEEGPHLVVVAAASLLVAPAVSPLEVPVASRLVEVPHLEETGRPGLERLGLERHEWNESNHLLEALVDLGHQIEQHPRLSQVAGDPRQIEPALLLEDGQKIIRQTRISHRRGLVVDLDHQIIKLRAREAGEVRRKKNLKIKVKARKRAGTQQVMQRLLEMDHHHVGNVLEIGCK